MKYRYVLCYTLVTPHGINDIIEDKEFWLDHDLSGALFPSIETAVVRIVESKNYSLEISDEDRKYYSCLSGRNNITSFSIRVGSFNNHSSSNLTWNDLEIINDIVKSYPEIQDSFNDYILFLHSLVDEIKKTRKLHIGKLFRNLTNDFEKFILLNIGCPDKCVLIPENSNVKVKTNIDHYYLSVEGGVLNLPETSANLLNQFVRVYEELFAKTCKEKSLFYNWPENVLIDVNRPVNDPLDYNDSLSTMRNGYFSDCYVYDSITGETCSYPLKRFVNSGQLVNILRKKSTSTKLLSNLFHDTVIDNHQNHIPSVALNSIDAFTKECDYSFHLKDSSDFPFNDSNIFSLIGDLAKNCKNFPEFIDKLNKNHPLDSNSAEIWSIHVQDYSGLFPPFELLRDRLFELGITRYEFDPKPVNDLWLLLLDIENNNGKYKSIDINKIQFVCTEYIEFLSLTNSKKYKEVQTIFAMSYPEAYKSAISSGRYANNYETNLIALFKHFQDICKDLIEPEAKEFYFGAKNEDRLNYVSNNEITLRQALSVDFEIVEELIRNKEDLIKINTKPLLNFMKSGLELGIDPIKLASTVEGDESEAFLRIYERSLRSVPYISTPINGKYVVKTAEEIVLSSVTDLVNKILFADTKRSIEIV
jgi:hypothetical protein